MVYMRERIRRPALVTAVIAGAVVGCQQDPLTSASRSAEPVPVTVTMHRVGGTATAQAVSGWLASAVGGQGSIDLSTVDSIMVTLHRIEFLPAVQDPAGEGADSGWLSLDVGDARFNLLALPTTPEAGIPLVTGELPPGDYAGVRLFVSDVTAWFNAPVHVGPAAFEPNVGYAVVVPSGDQSGIKTDQGFSIPEGGGDVVLVFDEHASLANVTATGNGKVILAPVIKVDGGAPPDGGTL